MTATKTRCNLLALVLGIAPGACAAAGQLPTCVSGLVPESTIPPELPRRLHNDFSGTARVSFVISPAGQVQSPAVVPAEWRAVGRSAGQPIGYDEAILSAVARWRYPRRSHACRHQVPVEIVATAGEPGPDTSDAWLDRVDQRGVRQVIAELADDRDAFDALTEEIERGDAGYLRVAAILRKGTDASMSLSLNYALARAIPRNPVGVLAIAVEQEALDRLCTSPYIEPDPGVAERYRRDAIAALNAVRGAMSPPARQCADLIRRGARSQARLTS